MGPSLLCRCKQPRNQYTKAMFWLISITLREFLSPKRESDQHYRPLEAHPELQQPCYTGRFRKGNDSLKMTTKHVEIK